MSITTPPSDPRWPSRGYKKPHTDRSVPAPEPIPDPVADFTYTPSAPVVGESVTFDGSPSTPDEHIVEHGWEVIGIGSGSGRVVEYAFPGPGPQQVRLTVRLGDGRSAQRTRGVMVTAPPDEETPPDEE